MKIGFIGLGIMGKPMVRNLLKAGHEVWVNNRSKAPMEELAEKDSEMLDAPVFGGEPKAVDGTLSFMASGKQAVFDTCKDLLAAMGCFRDPLRRRGCAVPMIASVQEILQWLHNNDCGGNDHSAIAQYYERLTGIKIGR